MDYNRDGRNDLVFWNEHHFEVPGIITFSVGWAIVWTKYFKRWRTLN